MRSRVIVPEPEDYSVVAEPIPLDVVYEDDDLLVINKPAGMVVHPAAGNWHGTLVNAVLHHSPIWREWAGRIGRASSIGWTRIPRG